MNKKEIAQKVIINNGGIAKTADFVAEGIKIMKWQHFARTVTLTESAGAFISFLTAAK